MLCNVPVQCESVLFLRDKFCVVMAGNPLLITEESVPALGFVFFFQDIKVKA